MFRTRRVLTSLCLLPLIGCGDDSSAGSADEFGSISATESSTETASDTSSEADSDGGTMSNDGGDGDTSTATAGDGDSATAGDGDSATAGDGDSATAGDGDSATAGDGDSATAGDGDSGDGDTSSTGGDGDGSGTGGDGDTSSTGGDGDTGDGDTGDGDTSTTGDGDSSSTSGDGDTGSTSSTSTDSSSTGGDGDGGTDGGACFELPFTVEPLTPNVVLVLDKSNSMFSNEISAGVTRWKQLHETVTNITMDFDGAVNFGSVLYPSTNATGSGAAACTVDPSFSVVPIAETNGSNVVGSMPGADTPSSDATAKGGTPAHDGLVIAYDAIDDAIAAFPDNPAFVILITDGAANCNTSLVQGDSTCGYSNDLNWTYDQRLQPLVLNENMSNGIDTYVVGIGMVEGEKTCADESILNFCSDPWKDLYGTDFPDCSNPLPPVSSSTVVPWDRLNDLADAGGVPQTVQMAGDSKFYNANNPQALNDALNNILGQLTSCELELTFSPPNPENPASVEVYVDDPMNPGNQVLVPQADCSMAGQNGWWYPNAPGSYQEIELCGTYCDSLLATGQAEIDFFCDAG